MMIVDEIRKAVEHLDNAEVEVCGSVLYVTDREYFSIVMGDKVNNFKTKNYKHRHFKKIIKKYS